MVRERLRQRVDTVWPAVTPTRSPWARGTTLAGFDASHGTVFGAAIFGVSDSW